MDPHREFTVGQWTVAPQRNLLLRGDQQIRVEPRVMDVLVYLARHHGEVVSKADLLERVWGVPYVTDDALTAAIYALRKALGDDARNPTYLETVPRRGYRWIAPVGTVHPRTKPWRLGLVAGATIGLAVLCVGLLSIRPWSKSRRHVASAEAHEAYVKGRFLLDQRSIQGWRNALDLFTRAVSLDPLDPAAQAGLADTYSAMSDFGVASPIELRPQALRAARRALALDPRSAEGYEALGRAQFMFDWNFDSAERNLGRALALNPDYMPAYQAMAWVESARGQRTAAVAAAQRALELDPVNTARYTEMSWILILNGRYADALNEVERALMLEPRSFQVHLMKGWIHELSGREDTAFAEYRQALRIAGAPEATLQRLDTVYRGQGLAGYYRDWVDRSAQGAGPPLSETRRAQLYVRAGERDRAIASLERAYQRRESALAWVNVEPTFAPLRSDAAFQHIAQRIPSESSAVP